MTEAPSRLAADPIAVARDEWERRGWADAAPGMAAVTSLMRAQQIVAARVDAALKPFGVTFARYELLMLLTFSRAGELPLKVIGSRLLQALPVILLATLMVFALLKLVPGDIAVTLAGDNATDARITEIRQLYGLDRPFLVQYGAWLGHVVQGDLSQSLLTGEKVADSIGRAFPNTLLIVVIALLLALLTGIPMGVIAAIKPNGWIDKLISMIASLGVAVPGFWLAMILVAEFSLKLNWLPATGAKSFSVSPIDAIRHALLPGIAIAAYGMAEVARQLRGDRALVGVEKGGLAGHHGVIAARSLSIA